MRIAALLTCHNRRDHTIECLTALYRQVLKPGITLFVVVVDDGCTDGTGELISRHFPKVLIIKGNGSLYWNRGMRLAFASAYKIGFDYYLWLNDDTILFPDAVDRLVAASERVISSLSIPAVIVGSSQDPNSGQVTYGGSTHISKWHPLRYGLIQPTTEFQSCQVMNGNCVLVPDEVAAVVGNLDPAFTHSIGDYDYALRVRRLGFEVCIAPGIIGNCPRNKNDKTWRDARMSLKDRWRLINSPKGLPIKEWAEYARRYAGPFWPIFAILPHMKLIASCLFSRTPKIHSEESEQA